MLHDPQVLQVFAAVFAVLAVATIIARIIAAGAKDKEDPTVKNLVERINSWWVMVAVLAIASAVGVYGACILFLFVSYQALREYIALTPTVDADRWALLWTYFIILPANYLLIAADLYGIFSIFIPVYAFLLLPIIAALGNDTQRFLERSAKLSYALRGRTRPGSRGALLDHATLEAIAKHLRANRSETRRLILLGMVEHAPRELRSAVIGMANDLVALAHRLNVQPPNLDFSGKDVELTPDI